MKTRRLKFTCPKCGKHEIERSESSINILTGIYGIEQNGDFGYEIPRFVRDPNPNSGSGWTHFQCKTKECDFMVEDDKGIVDNPKSLVKWIKENCSQD